MTEEETAAANRPVSKTNVGWRALQDRFERTRLGRAMISVFLLLTLVTLLTANLPASRLQDLLLSSLHPYLYGVGLDQSWGVFAPDPRRETIEVSARVTYADGTQATWRVQRRNPVVGAYVDYRWLKWTEYVISPAYSKELWEPAAVYVARKMARPGRRPTQVSLRNRWYELQPPDQISARPFVQERAFFTTRITEAMLRGEGS